MWRARVSLTEYKQSKKPPVASATRYERQITSQRGHTSDKTAGLQASRSIRAFLINEQPKVEFKFNARLRVCEYVELFSTCAVLLPVQLEEDSLLVDLGAEEAVA